jgi:FdhE protein
MTSPTPDLKEALLQLNRLKKDRPTLQGPADFFLDVLPGLFEEESRDRLPALTPETAQAKLAEGIPLLRGERNEIDPADFRRRWLYVAAAVERRQDSEAGKALAEVTGRDTWNAQEIANAALSGLPDILHAQAEALGLEPDLVGTVVRLCLFPILGRWNRALAPLLAGVVWERGFCATCGSWPLLGEFRGLEQIRWLRCGLCAAEWKVPRLFCPFCENRDHRSLGYFSLEGDGSKYRINKCDSCRCYLKMVTTLSPLSPASLLAADVATIHLDLAAATQNYQSWKPG